MNEHSELGWESEDQEIQESFEMTRDSLKHFYGVNKLTNIEAVWLKDVIKGALKMSASVEGTKAQEYTEVQLVSEATMRFLDYYGIDINNIPFKKITIYDSKDNNLGDPEAMAYTKKRLKEARVSSHNPPLDDDY